MTGTVTFNGRQVIARRLINSGTVPELAEQVSQFEADVRAIVPQVLSEAVIIATRAGLCVEVVVGKQMALLDKFQYEGWRIR